MVDIYIDEVEFDKIDIRKDMQELIFRNADKDETVHIPVRNSELLSMFLKVRIRCETLGIIPASNEGR